MHASGVAALAVRDLAEGHYEEAYARLKPLVDDPFLQVTPLEYPDFVEAAVRSDRLEDAAGGGGTPPQIAAANESAWALGSPSVAGPDRARMGPSPSTACDRHSHRGRARPRPARAHLLYGEWLRRGRRRREAASTCAAVDIFDDADAVASPGEPATSSRPPEKLDPADPAGADFTPQELTVAQLAAGGRTNAEIGAAMFLSANTVDYHLRKVFAKLGSPRAASSLTASARSCETRRQR